MLSCGNNDGSVRSYFPSWKETLHLYNSSRNERKEEWKPPHRALNKSSRNKFFDDILFNIPLSYELTSSSFPLPNLDHPHQNILSYAYPFFQPSLYGMCRLLSIQKIELVEFKRYFISLYILISEGLEWLKV